MKTVTFVTVANEVNGLGHFIRCLALAEMLAGVFNIHFIIDTDNEKIVKLLTDSEFAYININSTIKVYDIQNLLPLIVGEIVVIDFYGFKEQYQKTIKSSGFKLVCIDDDSDSYFYADVVINPSDSIRENDYRAEPYTKRLLGSNYALLRDVFLNNARARANYQTGISSVFVNMGGADIRNNTLKVLKDIVRASIIKEVNIVIGAINGHRESLSSYASELRSAVRVNLYQDLDSNGICDVIKKSSLAICPASGISKEVCSIGVPLITGFTEKNQLRLLDGLISTGCAINLGNMDKLDGIQIPSTINLLNSNPQKAFGMVQSQKSLIDGRSGERIRQIFECL